MHADNFILDDYLKRISFVGNPKADVETLSELMRHQLLSIPFENIDVHLTREVSLIPEDLVRKIIYSRRGGYCYELNGIFAMALSAIGFSYSFCGARPMFYPTLRPKTHVVIIVQLDGNKWLCDLGFGSFGIRTPISLEQLDVTIAQDYDRFMLSKMDTDTYLLKALKNNEWNNQFSFDLYPMKWIDLLLPNYFNSTNVDTIFVQKLLAIRYTSEGRIILVGNKMTRYIKGQVEECFINPDDIVNFLESDFLIDWPAIARQK